jgi:hypothetical protein
METHDGRSGRGGYDPTQVTPASDRTAPMPAQPADPAASADSGAAGRGRYAEPRIQARDLGRRGIITPFARLARGQAFSVMGEALFAIGLAGTVFFSTDPNQSRAKVAGYLVLTFAPFVVAAPFIGPLIDRAAGGRRWVIFGAAVVRALLCLLLLRDLDDLLFYPEAFLMLVFSKVNLISKAALVPTTVRNDEELVEANSKLTSLGALAAVAGAVLAGIATLIVKIPFLRLQGEHSATSAILLLGAVAFVATAVQAWNLPPTRVAEHQPDATEKAELRSAGIFLASTATSLSRLTMGFLTFLLAFWVKNEDRALAWIGVLVGAAQIGYFIGSAMAPRVRRLISEERMIQYSLAGTTVAAAVTLLFRDVGTGLVAASVLAFAVGLSSNLLKQAFDSLVQRDAPDANRGQSFAKFETRFQLWWAIGALIPVIIPIPLWIGIFVIGAVSGFALVSYLLGLYEMTEVVAGRRQPRERKPKPWSLAWLRARRSGGPPVVEPVVDSTVAWASAPTGVELDVAGAPGVGAYDTTLTDGVVPTTPGLFGESEPPIPADLTTAPEGGLFDPSAPPPARVAGYLEGAPARLIPSITSDAPPPHAPPPDSGELDIVELPGGGFANVEPATVEPATVEPATVEPATGEAGPPVPDDDASPLPFDTAAETDEWEYAERDGTRTTNELPIVTPPGPHESF